MGCLQRRALKGTCIGTDRIRARESESDVTLSLLVSSGPFLLVFLFYHLQLSLDIIPIAATTAGASSVPGSVKCLSYLLTEFAPQFHRIGAVTPISCEDNEAQGG